MYEFIFQVILSLYKAHNQPKLCLFILLNSIVREWSQLLIKKWLNKVWVYFSTHIKLITKPINQPKLGLFFLLNPSAQEPIH